MARASEAEETQGTVGKLVRRLSGVLGAVLVAHANNRRRVPAPLAPQGNVAEEGVPVRAPPTQQQRPRDVGDPSAFRARRVSLCRQRGCYAFPFPRRCTKSRADGINPMHREGDRGGKTVLSLTLSGAQLPWRSAGNGRAQDVVSTMQAARSEIASFHKVPAWAGESTP
jgi:hypothetical protein